MHIDHEFRDTLDLTYEKIQINIMLEKEMINIFLPRFNVFYFEQKKKEKKNVNK